MSFSDNARAVTSTLVSLDGRVVNQIAQPRAVLSSVVREHLRPTVLASHLAHISLSFARARMLGLMTIYTIKSATPTEMWC